MNDNKSTMFFGWLALLFIGLKLTDYIDWSWWLVLAPLWAPIALVVVGALIYIAVSVMYEFRR